MKRTSVFTFTLNTVQRQNNARLGLHVNNVYVNRQSCAGVFVLSDFFVTFVQSLVKLTV